MFTPTMGQGESLSTSMQQSNDIYNVYHQTMFTLTMGQGGSLSTPNVTIKLLLAQMAPISNPSVRD